MQESGQHLGIDRAGEEGLQVGLGAVGIRVPAAAFLRFGMDEGEHGGDDVLLGPGELEDLLGQIGGQGPFRGKGEDQQVRAPGAVHDELVQLQGSVEDDGAPGEIVHPLVPRSADIPLHDIEAFPEIVALPGERVPVLIMHLEQGVHICDPDLFPDGICQPDHWTFHKNLPFCARPRGLPVSGAVCPSGARGAAPANPSPAAISRMGDICPSAPFLHDHDLMPGLHRGSCNQMSQKYI